MWKRLFGLFAVLVVFVAAGCGDDSGEESTDETEAPDTSDGTEPSTTSTSAAPTALADWVEQADEICATATEDRNALGDPQTPEEIMALLPDAIEISAQELDDLQALGLPDEKAESVTDALGLVQQRLDLLQQANDDVEGGADPAEVFLDINTEVEAIQAQLADLATDVGLEECGASDSDSTTSTTTPTTGGSSGELPTTGDEAIDAMLAACAEGNGVACDQAYALTEVGSDAEAFADTCGETEASGTVCSSVMQGTKIQPERTTGTSYGDDVDFDQYYDNCADGDMSQCDLLYLTSPIGSEYEEFGGTCGGTFSKEEAPFSCATGE